MTLRCVGLVAVTACASSFLTYYLLKKQREAKVKEGHVNPSLDNIDAKSLILFSGPLTIDKATLETKYAPYLLKAIEKECKIIVGGAESGADKFVVDFCNEKRYYNVEIFVPTKGIMGVDDPSPFCAHRKYILGSFKDRDRAMLAQNPDYFVGCYSQYGGAASGTAANMLAFALGIDGYKVASLLRAASLPYDQSLLEHVVREEANLVVAPKKI